MSDVTDWGVWRVSVDGHDVTEFRGARAKIKYQVVEPFGCGPGELVIPALSPLEDLGAVLDGAFHYGAFVNVWQFLPDDAGRVRMWSGSLGRRKRTITSTQGRITWTLLGDMEEAGNQMWQPPVAMDPTDIGVVIAAALNGVVGRRYAAVASVNTGIKTTARGSEDQTVLAYVQELLSTATTADGTRQWTVRRVPNSLNYVIALKALEFSSGIGRWDVTAGAPGVQPDIELDEVPTRWFGQGVNPDGGWWGNWRYPGASADAAPAYPFSDPSTTMAVGSHGSDSQTDTGSGISDLQQRINDLNLTKNIAVDGTLNPSDAAVIREIQEHYGLSVDGVVGPQTWAALFNVGAGAVLGKPVRLPLAWHHSAVPRLWNADGSDAGPNPAYDPSDSPPVIDTEINVGSGVTRSQGRGSIQAQFARDWPPGHLGTLTLSTDPSYGSRFDIQPGDWITIRELGGGTPSFHVSAVQVDCDRGVQLMLDQKSRDLLSLVQIRQRRRGATNPARIPTRSRNRRAMQTHDAVVPFDSESPAGQIPKFAIFGGLWSVIHIPVSQAGVLSKVVMTSSGPAAKWAMAFFGAPVEASDLQGWVGNPFGSDSPWDDAQDDMEDAGLIECWGSKADACGQKRNGDIDGKFKDQANITYRSLKPPWVWIAVRSPTSTFLRGRLYPGPIDA